MFGTDSRQRTQFMSRNKAGLDFHRLFCLLLLACLWFRCLTSINPQSESKPAPTAPRTFHSKASSFILILPRLSRTFSGPTRHPFLSIRTRSAQPEPRRRIPPPATSGWSRTTGSALCHCRGGGQRFCKLIHVPNPAGMRPLNFLPLVVQFDQDPVSCFQLLPLSSRGFWENGVDEDAPHPLQWFVLQVKG